MELLSPAGDLESALAALEFGADAVYLGLKKFSARAELHNFSLEDLSYLLAVAKSDAERPRCIYVAVNTLLHDAELPELIALLAELEELAVDAVIVQDLGLYGIVRRHFPRLPLHASTQLAIHNVAGMLQAREMGFSRVIAARELGREEIGNLAALPGIELEVFVHGSLCYAYSGLCLLSSMLRGSSGNRGACSHYCRNPFQVWQNGRLLEENAALMSMKDLALGEFLPQLRKAGVKSLKIEGRKKSPLYVAAVTNYYRKLLDGSFTAGERELCEAHIKSIFSRPWSSFHWRGSKSETVTDSKTGGPRGLQVGTVLQVINKQGEPSRLRFVLQNQKLEKYDGLQLEIPRQHWPYGFSVSEIRVFSQGSKEQGRRVFVAEPGSSIEVPLPKGHPRISPGQAIYCNSSQQIKRAYSLSSARPAPQKSRRGISIELSVQPHLLSVIAKPETAATALSVEVSLAPDEAFGLAQKPELLLESARGAFAKLGDSDFYLAEFNYQNPQNCFVPVTLLNELRRLTMKQVEAELAERRQSRLASITHQVMTDEPSKPAMTVHWSLKLDRAYYLNLFDADALQAIDELVFDPSCYRHAELEPILQELVERFGHERLRLALPAIIRAGSPQGDWGKLCKELVKTGWRRWQVANLGAFQILKEAGADGDNCNLTADWQLYAGNRAAIRTLLELGLQRVTIMPDESAANRETLLRQFPSCLEQPVYGHPPLAISAVCAEHSRNGHCPGAARCDFNTLELVSRKNERLLVINRHCQSVYISNEALDLSAELPELHRQGARFFRADFCLQNYTPSTVAEIWGRLIRCGANMRRHRAGAATDH
ncbi:MAG: U32 family peptidase [Oligosphaeraceae bacterium]|nr:U32 family peptidase [Oligosphaeraceae bacterium]